MPNEFELVTSISGFVPRTPTEGPTRLIEAARSAEADGVDALLIGYTSSSPDGWMLASSALAATSRIRVLLAHRPGIMSPSAAARMTATLDALWDGRVSLNVISGGSAADQKREGDFVEHDDRYRRAIEYVGIMKRLWTEPEPVDHEGEFYHLENSSLQLKPSQKPHPPIYMGGASDAGKAFAIASADAYMSWSEPVDHVRERFDEIRQMSADAGREAPRFSVSMRCIFGESEEAAWAKATAMVPEDVVTRAKRTPHREDIGRNRQLGLASESLVHDERLWMGLTAATGGQGSTGALVGTVEQIEESLLRYVEEARANTLLLTGPNGGYEAFPDGFVESLRNKANRILARS